MVGNIFSFLPVLLIIGAFWAITKKKRAASKLVKRKDDVWYVLKEYLKLSGRSGARIADLALYPRAQTISSLREYIKSTKECLKEERNKILGLKERKTPSKFFHLKGKKSRESYPEKEEYHRDLELRTLKVVAETNSSFREYLELCKKLQDDENFRELSSQKLIGESISRISKHRKKVLQRNRYLVCFRLYQTNRLKRNLELSEWEAIEIELFKNPRRESGKKYKILFTAVLKYSEELHWIYALQQKYLRDKILSQKNREREAKEAERKLKNRALAWKIVYLPIILSKKLGQSIKKAKN